MKQEKWAKAVDLPERATRLDGSNARYLMDLGTAYGGARRFEDAERVFLRSQAIDPMSAQVVYNWVITLRDQEKWDTAIEKFKRATELDASHIGAWEQLGAALTHRGRYVESEAAFGRVVRLDPRDTLAKFNLGLVLVEQGKIRDATAVRGDPACRC